MFRIRGLTFQLSLLILTSAGIISVLLYGYNFYNSANILYKEVDKNATSTVEKFAFRIESIVKNVEKVAYLSRNFIEETNPTEEELERFLRRTVERNNEIFGSSICYEPYMFDSTINLFSKYYYKDGGDIKSADLSSVNYYYPEQNWYKVSKEFNTSNWSEPYYDEGGGNILMTTFSIPIYKHTLEGQVFRGVITCDLSLTWLKDLISEMNVYENGYGFLISKEGRFIAHPDTSLIMNKTMFDLANDSAIPVLNELGKRMIAGERGDITTTSVVLGTKSLVRFYPVEQNGWSLAVLFPHKEIYSDLFSLGIEVVVFGFLGFVLLFLVLVWISKKLSKPLNVIMQASEKIAIGDLKTATELSFEYSELYKQISDDSGKKGRKIYNEIIRLFISIDQMTANLYRLIGQVQRSGIQVGSSTNEITASSRELEANASQQAASTKEVSATSRQISETSSELSDSIDNINKKATYTLDIAHKGKESLAGLEDAIGNLNLSTKSITNKLSVINERANKISSVVTAINKISEQTNLLSFNAAIEAEKAGEYGKGFAVVAREISRLADQTAVATEDIEKMVKEMQSSVSSGVMEMDKFSDEVRKGAGHIYSVAEQLGEVIEQVNDFAPSFNKFAGGMQLQTESAMQISDTMTQLAKASEQSKEALAEFRKASSQLNEAVMILQTEVKKFIL
ncbi:MAG: methyl-accepting chemotaxis protein [Candidatus Kapabacteria bacterium]|nr:methyl-accepting chemotaxis protein [Ignavibacteriota bacterium]MCW5884725.1 methyl-accepting chemotaxis protein [Candidatus Kapabacteria bacterium]